MHKSISKAGNTSQIRSFANVYIKYYNSHVIFDTKPNDNLSLSNSLVGIAKKAAMKDKGSCGPFVVSICFYRISKL